MSDGFIIFHVTPQENKTSIDELGIDPRFHYPSRKSSESYWSNEDALMWAIAHTSKRWQIPADRLLVYWTNSAVVGARKFFNRGIYRVANPLERSQFIGGASSSYFMNKFAEGVTMLEASIAYYAYKHVRKLDE